MGATTRGTATPNPPPAGDVGDVVHILPLRRVCYASKRIQSARTDGCPFSTT
jgi:hypothetical protein